MLLLLRRCFWEVRLLTLRHPFASLAGLVATATACVHLSEDRYRFLTAESRARLEEIDRLPWRERWYANFRDKQRLLLPKSVFERLFGQDP